ncbi:MAG: 4-(cytidine 5'-diphospho)-2-C-methyl-D-erythritol kinase [Candidatus Methylopumilus sp.]|nr:4-(cytidine 5'-diphospho)-2-C-methyl-D-erythritol kinase [Candidatus Methylopumilus sp.]
MPNFQTFLAPAKINLFLHITGQRADGYHLLQTVFRLIDLHDTIQLSVREDGIINRVNDIAGVPAEQDLCVRAARLLQKHSGCRLGVDLQVEKRIPMGGGLGGGSSDAATVLLALNRLWQLDLKRRDLLQLGLQLGADVPFFIHGQNAWAEGVGEQLQSISLADACYLVLTPDVHVSTAQIFANKQLTKNAIPKTMSDFSRAANSASVNSGQHNTEFTNQLEKAVCSDYPAVSACLTWLKQFGDARMSGSGASVFVEVANEKIAHEICLQNPAQVLGFAVQSFVAKGLNQHPLIDYASD